jgi:hypothetical protein
MPRLRVTKTGRKEQLYKILARVFVVKVAAAAEEVVLVDSHGKNVGQSKIVGH